MAIDASITGTPIGAITGSVTNADDGTINGTIGFVATGTISSSMGVPGPAGSPGATGPQGPQGIPGPPGEGGTWGSIVGDIEDQVDLWSELGSKYPASNPSGFITASALSPYLTTATANATFQTLAGMSSYLTTSAAAAGYYPLTGNPSGFLTAASLSGYATESWVTGQGYITSAALSPYLTSATASATYAPIAAGMPTSGTVGQVLTKQSGSSYDAAWATLIPGDRYLTTSTTSNTIGNGTKTFTVGTGLSYSSQQDVVISYDASNHMHALVTSYDSGTGVLVVDVQHHTGVGTYASWTVNVGGTTPLQSVEWGEILGVIGDQADLAGILNNKLEITDAASTYYPLTNPAGYITSSALTGYATESFVTSQGYITSSALSPYLLSSTAASTYQTIAGMSSYLTTSTAASTYAPIASPTFTGLSTFNNPGNYAITVDNSPGNYTSISSGVYSIFNSTTEVIRLSASGIKYPDGVTQSVAYPGSSSFLLKADNLSGLASVSTARTNLGLGTMAVETASNYLTTATAASTYQTISGMSSYLTTSTAASTYQTISGMSSYLTTSSAASTYAPLASPALTGTPTAPTAAASTNTTQIATTAFVQQEVPAASTTAAGKVELATNSEAHAQTSSAVANTPSTIPFALCSGMLSHLDFMSATAVSGSGAVTYLPGFREMYLSSTAVGRSAFFLGGQSGTTYTVFGSNANEIRLNFSKKLWVSGRAAIGINASYAGDSTNVALVTLGGYTTLTTGNMTSRGIGWRKAGGTSSVVELIVHNGTTFTAVSTTKTLATREQFEYMIYSDGTGNVTLYIDGAQAATTSAGPTGSTADFGGIYREQVEQNSTATTRLSMHCYGGTLYSER